MENNKIPTVEDRLSGQQQSGSGLKTANSRLIIFFIAVGFAAAMMLGVIISGPTEDRATFDSAIKPEADKNVYANHKYKFSLQYPRNFQFKENPQIQKQSLIFVLSGRENSGLSSEQVFISLSIGEKSVLDKTYGSYDWTKKILDSMSDVQTGGIVETESDILIKRGTLFVDGTPAVMYEVDPKRTGEGIFPSTNIAMEKDEVTYLFSTHAFHGNDIFTLPSINVVFNDIIKSLKWD